MKDKKLLKYLIFAFALAWPVQALASWFSLRGNALAFQLIMVGCMFMPLLATVLAGIPLKGMGWGLNLKGKWKWVLAAWLAPITLALLGAALYFLLFPGQLDFSGAYLKAQITAAAGEDAAAEAMAQLREKGISMPLLALIYTVQAVSYAAIINTFVSLGEEVGWRGAMLPRLKERFGRRGGWLLGGVIWGAWHWPVMLLEGYEYGTEYWGAPVLGPIAFCLFTTALGLLLDLCYEKTGSIWIPSLGHGAVNAAAAIPLLLWNPDFAERMILGPCMNSLLAAIPLLALALYVLIRAKGPAEEPEAPAA